MYVNVNHHPPVLVSSNCLIINDPKYIQYKLIRQNQLFSFRTTRIPARWLYENTLVRFERLFFKL